MIKQVSVSEVRKSGYGENVKDVEQFLESGWDCCEIECDESRAFNSYNNFYILVRRKNYPIRVVKSGNRVFLIRKKEGEE